MVADSTIIKGRTVGEWREMAKAAGQPCETAEELGTFIDRCTAADRSKDTQRLEELEMLQLLQSIQRATEDGIYDGIEEDLDRMERWVRWYSQIRMA